MLKITATPIKGKDLQPGDLFSTAGPEYWTTFGPRDSIGEKCYVRTETPSALSAGDEESTVFKLTIEKTLPEPPGLPGPVDGMMGPQVRAVFKKACSAIGAALFCLNYTLPSEYDFNPKRLEEQTEASLTQLLGGGHPRLLLSYGDARREFRNILERALQILRRD